MKLFTSLFLSFGTALIIQAVPVQYLSIDASFDDGNVVVEWVTISENANLQFIVERSPDGSEWNAIGTVSGSNNSTTLVQYQYTDENPFEDVSYYRIRQMDYSGMQSYSQVLAVDPSLLWLDGVNLFPNPASDWLNLSLAGFNKNVEVTIMDSLGAIIKTITWQTPGILQVNVDDLPKGFYHVQCAVGQHIVTKRILKR